MGKIRDKFEKVKDKAWEQKFEAKHLLAGGKRRRSEAHEAAKDRVQGSPLSGYLQAIFRGSGFICLAFSFYFIFGQRPILRLAPLLTMAFGMLTFPSGSSPGSGKPTPKELALVYMRSAVGISLSVIFALTFASPLMGVSLYLLAAFIFLSLGFFVPIPRSLGEDKKGEEIEIDFDVHDRSGDFSPEQLLGVNFLKKAFWACVTIGFFVVAWNIVNDLWGLGHGQLITTVWPIVGFGVAGLVIFVSWKYGTTSSLWFGSFVAIGLLLGIWSLSGTVLAVIVFSIIVLVGYIGGLPVPDARPILGIPIVVVALFAATAAYPQVMGEAMFGQWWPTVNQRIEAAQTAVSPAMREFTQVQDTLGTGWQCLVSPQECYQLFRPDTEVEKSYRALAITRPEPMGVGEIREPLTEGDGFSYRFYASNELTEEEVDAPPTIEGITFSPMQMYDSSEKERTVKGPVTKDIKSQSYFETGPGCEDDTECEGVDLRPGQEATFMVEHPHFWDDVDPGHYLRYGVEAEYNVDTYADLDVEVVTDDVYRDLTEGDFFEPTSRFEWGPVAVGMGVARQQPINEDQSQPLFFPVTNRGQGYLKQIESLSISLDDEPLDDCSEDIMEFVNNEIEDMMEDQERNLPSEEKLGLEPDKTIDAACTIPDGMFDVEEGPDTEMTLLAEMEYKYEVKEVNTIQVMYACLDDDDCDDEYECDQSTWECSL